MVAVTHHLILQYLDSILFPVNSPSIGRLLGNVKTERN